MATRKSQSDHDGLVQNLVSHLTANGYSDIKADLTGHTQPATIHWTGKEQSGHIPDATATKDGTPYLFEVETDDSITDDHTEDQWKLFAANAKQHNKTFVVLVPTDAKQAALDRVSELGITADVWTG